MDPKALKALAKACREAGITKYREGDIEFTLTPDAPLSEYKKKKSFSPEVTPIETDTLTDDQLLMWSTGNTQDS